MQKWNLFNLNKFIFARLHKQLIVYEYTLLIKLG